MRKFTPSVGKIYPQGVYLPPVKYPWSTLTNFYLSDSQVNYPVCSGVKSILKLYLGKSIVTDGKTTRSEVESID